MRTSLKNYFPHDFKSVLGRRAGSSLGYMSSERQLLFTAALWASLFGLYLLLDTISTWTEDGKILLVHPILGTYLLVRFGKLSWSLYRARNS